jgi:hypothetical protein
MGEIYHMNVKTDKNETTKYEIDNNVFIVESVFNPDGKENISDIIIRLIKADITDL